MTTLRTKQEILKSLDCILAETKWKGPPSDISHLDSPAHLSNFKKLGNQEQVTSQRIITALRSAKKESKKFRVCSIGCGDGKLDKLILEGCQDTTIIQYVGLDIDEQVVDGAEEILAGTLLNIEISTVAVDYEDLSALKNLALEQFDLIWMVNCTYYAASLASLLQGALELLKPSGVLLIVSSSKQSLEQLVTRFWFHQRQDSLHTTESLETSLMQLSIPYQVQREPITFDLTMQLANNFESAASELVLDHLVFCRLSDYGPKVKSLVIEYLQSIAKSGKVISLSDLILISLS